VDNLIEDYEGRITKEGIYEAAKVVQKFVWKHLPPLPKIPDEDICDIDNNPEPKSKPRSKSAAA
jgi:hypothetical protein